ncbi:MAG: HIT family protein [Patescibacteria group bacterium]|jgi:histidine triad (HIT) family protein
MEDCIFCKIVKGELPSYKVYEDEDTLAFLDIYPTTHGHTLVIPKEHFKDMEEIPEEILQRLILTVKKIGKSLKESLAIEAYNICENNGQVAGQVVPHIHFHLIPRYKDDNLKPWPQTNYPEGKAEEILNKIKIN